MNSHHEDNVNLVRRNNWIKEKLQNLSAGLRILDAGSGEQPYRDWCNHLNYVSQDFNSYDPQHINNGLQMESWNYRPTDIVSDITEIPEPDASFDCILCTEVLEHVPDPVKVLKEFRRLLKPGGILLITAPFCSLTHFAPYHFATGFNEYFFMHHLPQMDFELRDVQRNGNYFMWLEQELRRLPSVADRYVGKHPGRIEYRMMKHIRKLLLKYSEEGESSSELLHFGCHIEAVRK
jgi:SAM-dependent methyltransferase